MRIAPTPLATAMAVAAVVALLGGCAAPQVPHAASATRSLAESGPLTFINSSGFDDALREALSQDSGFVDVELPGVSLQSFPERMDKWLSATKQSGGSVRQVAVAAPGEPGGRSLALVVDAVVKLYDLARQHLQYRPVEGYDALVEYERSTGALRRVRFLRRGSSEAGPPAAPGES